MHGTATRRQILQGMGALAVGLAYGAPSAVFAGARVHSKRVISMQPRLYHGWPTLARRRNGELLLVCSGGRESHVCPFGRVELMRSRDEGSHWSFPRVLIDGPIDDRDAGVVETAEGSLLVTTFTSIGYADILARAEELESQGKGAWTQEKLERWQAIHRRITAAEREIELGSWMIRSTDGGRSWSAPYRCPVNSPHGPIQLSDGRPALPRQDLLVRPQRTIQGAHRGLRVHRRRPELALAGRNPDPQGRRPGRLPRAAWRGNHRRNPGGPYPQPQHRQREGDAAEPIHRRREDLVGPPAPSGCGDCRPTC